MNTTTIQSLITNEIQSLRTQREPARRKEVYALQYLQVDIADGAEVKQLVENHLRMFPGSVLGGLLTGQ